MEKPDPHKRKSIRDKEVPINEMRENDKNSATVMQSKYEKRYTDKTSNEIDVDEISISDDEEEGEIETPDTVDTRNITKNQLLIENIHSTNAQTENFLKHVTEDVLTKRIYSFNSNKYEQKSHTTNKIDPKIERYLNNSSLKTNQSKKYTDLQQRLSKSTIENNNSRNYIKYIVHITLVILVIIVSNLIAHYIANYYSQNPSQKNLDTIDSENSVLSKVKTDLRKLSSKYTNQETNLWNKAYSSIKYAIKKPEVPSIILLLGNEYDSINCLATLLGNVSNRALKTHSLFLSPEKFQSNVGFVIESLRSEIKKKTVIIWDLLNINVEALKAFHNLCDRINPLVKEVIFIITIITDNYDEQSNPIEFIEKELFKKLSDKMDHDSIQPLITRITDGHILTVKPEPTITDCPYL